MKIYFTASTTEKGEYIVQYRSILQYLKSHHTVVSGEQIVDFAKLAEDAKLTQKEIFSREKKRIDSSDCVIAEVTKASTGVGIDIAYALTRNKPVLALFYKETERKISPMLAGNPSDYLYLEHYDDDNVNFKLRVFLAHVVNLKERKGKVIVIDGGDGSGKTTQAELLVTYLKAKNIKVKYYDFPRYYSSFHGQFVGRFLSGEFGKLDEVSPYLTSLAYTFDRASVRGEMEQWLKEGGYIVCNRYTTSSMAHQAAKLPPKKRQEYLEWLDELEYKQHKMPRPDLVIYLYVPWRIGLELTSKKENSRRYVKGADIAEKNINHRKEAEKMYLFLAGNKKNWVKVDCIDKEGKILAKEEIHGRVVEMIKKQIIKF